MTELADNGSFEKVLETDENKVERTAVKKRKRKLNILRKKRLQRKQRKKEEFRKLSKQERRSKMKDHLSSEFKDEIDDLELKLHTVKNKYKKERRISAYCWAKWKKEHTISKKQNG
jgi:hypothetical protein